jgi:hypothetical protein
LTFTRGLQPRTLIVIGKLPARDDDPSASACDTFIGESCGALDLLLNQDFVPDQ